MPYLVIDSDRAIVSGGILPTQTAADTLAATVNTWTAHMGDVTGGNFHANAEPGWYLTTAGVTVQVLPLSALQTLKNVMSEAHHYLMVLQADLHTEGGARLWTEVVTVHDYMARVHQSNYRIVKENPQGISVANRTTYATELLAGPQDISHVRLTVSELFDALADPGQSVGPDIGVTYVNPETRNQITISDSQGLETARTRWGLGAAGSPLVVSEAQLVSGLWTEAITA